MEKGATTSVSMILASPKEDRENTLLSNVLTHVNTIVDVDLDTEEAKARHFGV